MFPRNETRWDVRHCLFRGLWSSTGSTEEGLGREVSLNKFKKTATKAGDSRWVKCGWRLHVSFNAKRLKADLRLSMGSIRRDLGCW
jgi:hypothetical protein